MPALPFPGPVLKVDILFQVGSDAAALTRYFLGYTGSAPTAGAIDAFAGLLNPYCDDALPPLMHADTTYLGCTWTDLASSTGVEGTFPESSAGSRAGAALGADVCLLANMAQGRRYRGGKPRGYWPLGTATDLQTRQTWTSDFTSAAVTILQDIYSQNNDQSADGCTITNQVNVSYYGPPNRIITGSTGRVRTVSTVRAVPIVDSVTAVSINDRLASQRRRNLIRS